MTESLKAQYAALDGANRFLAEHCGNTLDAIRKECRGICHSVNRCNAEYADCWSAVQDLQKQMEERTAAEQTMMAAIGELQESLAKAREAFANLQKRISNGG